MDEFWNNISRYPRFFISSLVGLILILLTPIRNLLKLKKFRIVLPFVSILFLSLLYRLILAMTGL
jgi:hypothetical protein